MPSPRDDERHRWTPADHPRRGVRGERRAAPYGSTFHGYGLGYAGGARRSRGSYGAGELRSGLEPRDEFEFEWGEGYVGGRGYGGTNYDLRHGYRVGPWNRAATREEWGGRPAARPAAPPAVPPRLPPETASDRYGSVGTEVGVYGPARYGYGPYFERLKRRRRPDDEIRRDVEDALFYDTWVDADRIRVSVEDGVVTLSGTLASYDEVRYATDDAWDVDGVRGVIPRLAVDESLAARGRAAPGGREATESRAEAGGASRADAGARSDGGAGDARGDGPEDGAPSEPERAAAGSAN